MGEEDDLGLPELANGRQMLSNPSVVQELPGRRIDRRVDVDPE
jgi:hypothetical protein